jgi:hypothetical protein
MLVPFVINADSLTPEREWSDQVSRKCHHDLFEIWRRFGLLVHDGDEIENSSLKRAIDALPQKMRPQWQAMLDRCPYIPCRNGWDGAVTLAAKETICAFASLALVDNTLALAEFDLAEEQTETVLPSATARQLVVCHLFEASCSSVFKAAEEISGRHIEIGEDYRKIWNLRFRPLALAAIKNISLVDRYAIEQHLRPRDGFSGLERFLHLLDQDASGPRYVKLYASWTSKLWEKFGDPTTESTKSAMEPKLKKLAGRLPKGNVERLTVQLVPDRDFKVFARDRFLRFGDYVWDLGHGLDSFEGSKAAKSCSASFKADAASYKKVELGLDACKGGLCIPLQRSPDESSMQCSWFTK